MALKATVIGLGLFGWIQVLTAPAGETPRSAVDLVSIAQELENPVSPLFRTSLSGAFDFRMGASNDGWRSTTRLQPIIPIALNSNWNLIVRTDIPYLVQEDALNEPTTARETVRRTVTEPVYATRRVFTGSGSGLVATETVQVGTRTSEIVETRTKRLPRDRHQNGLGDITQSFLFSPNRKSKDALIWGAGPALLYPSATDSKLGDEQWGIGPEMVLLHQGSNWTAGLFARQLWGFGSGSDDIDREDVNITSLQPFFAWTARSATTVALNLETNYDWSTEQWTVPANLRVSQMFTVGDTPVQTSLSGRYNLEGPSGDPEWGIQFTVTLAFPR